MRLKERIIKGVKSGKTAKLLLYVVIITVILDAITTLYALEIGLYEINSISFIFMQDFGIYLGLTIMSIGKISFFTFGYLMFKNLSSNLLVNNKKNWAFLFDGFLFFILLIISINTFLTVINNLSQIWQKINIV